MSNPPAWKNYRWIVCGLLFLATTINYVDRQVLSLLKPTLSDEFGWTELDYSHIVMSFSAAYAAGYLLFGWIVDRVGTKIGYSLSVLLWSLAAMGHALAKTTLGFGFMRGLLGVSEAGNFPTAVKTTAEWFPKKERAFATGIFNSGTNVGALVAPIAIPWILGVYGWQMAFILTGLLGLLWLVAWFFMYEIPSLQARLSQKELAIIRSDDERTDNQSTAAIPWISLLRMRQTWAYILGKLFTDPIWYFLLFWLPAYFAEVYEVDLRKPSLELALIYSATTIGSIGGGYLSSWLIRRGWEVYRARRTAMLWFALAVTPVMLVRFTDHVWVAVLFMSLAAAAHQAWSANIMTTVSDNFPGSSVSSVAGIGGMAGSIGGILFPLLVGNLLDHYKQIGQLTSGYNILFLIGGLAYLVAWGVMGVVGGKRVSGER
ncbi:MAG: MFS transporter [Bacteroidetes bacterium]|nr:MFS transporter [Bacteroidota bacterium]